MKYRRYAEYKDSGVEWLGEVPAHWSVCALSYCARITTGSTPDRNKQEYWGGSIPWIKTGEIDYTLITEAEEYITQDGLDNSSTKLAPKGTLLMAMYGQGATRGKVATLGIEAAFNQACAAISLDENVNTAFAYYYFVFAYDFTRDTGNETSQMNLSAGVIAKIKLLIPPTQEQAAIVAFLACEVAQIDALIAKQERLIAVLQEKRQALISHAVTKGLNPDAPMKDSGVEWLGEVPAHWQVRRNKSIYQEIDDRSTTGEEELLSVSHITGVTARSEKTVNMFMAETLENYKRCQPGDLVINTMWAYMGALGTAKISGVVSPSYNVYRGRKLGETNPQYIDYLYRIPRHVIEVGRNSRGVWESRLRLYPDEFLDMRTPLPPRPEQDQIVEYIRQKNEQYVLAEKRCRHCIELLQERRAALISAAVTGKIDVQNQVSY